MHSLWGRQNISPDSWTKIGFREVALKGLQPTNEGLCEWLRSLGLAVQPNNISVVRRHKTCGEKLQPRTEAILEAIISNVSFQALMSHLEQMSFSALMGFIPVGNPFRVQNSKIPFGTYQSSRFSFRYKGELLRSGITFYRNPKALELVGGYSDIEPHVLIDHSSVLRYVEIEKSERRGTISRKSVNSGFVLYEGRSFVLVGVALELEPNAMMDNLEVKDIRKAKGSFITLADDANSDIYFGMEVTSQSMTGGPGAAIVKLEKVSDTPHLRESDILDSGIELGYVEESDEKYSEMAESIKAENNIDGSLLFIR